MGPTPDFGDRKSEPGVAGVGTPPSDERAVDPKRRDIQNRKPRPAGTSPKLNAETEGSERSSISSVATGRLKRRHAGRFAGAMAILAAFLVIVTLDGPGLTVDEPLDVRPGRTYVESLTRERWRFFDRDVVIRVFRDNAEHPPLGRWLLGIASKLGEPLEVLWKGPDPTSQYVLSGRLAPAFAFAALVGVVVYQGTLRWGNAAGLGAGFALMAMPRVFAHAHLGALDTFLSLFWTVAVLAADGAIRSRSPVRNMALAGVCWGLVLLTKIHGWLLIPLVSVWSLYWLGFRRGSAVLVLWAAVGVGLFFAAWPWLWYDTWERFSHYWGTGLTRAPIRVAYFGEIFDDNELPWHYPWFYFAVTVPVGLQPLGLLGLLRGWRERRAEPLPILLAGTIVLFLALFSTRVPVYDGERLFLLVFPAWALLIGAGLAWVWSWCGSRRWLRGALVALVLAQSWGVVSIHPFGLSYFNAFVGGLRGAQRLGLELTYWGDAVSNRLLDRLAAEANPGEKAALVPTLYPGQGILTTGFDRTLARREVILGDEEQSLRADWVVVSRRVAYLRREFLDRLKNEGGTRVATTSRDGVVLAELWHFPPSSSGNPASRAGFRRSEE